MTAISPNLESLSIDLFADGADLDQLRRLAAEPHIQGFTTNPSHMRKAGITDYETFAREAVNVAGQRPISLEVFADEFDEMVAQARTIASWGSNIFVKLPVTDTKGSSSSSAIRTLSEEGVQLNVTALTTVGQVDEVTDALNPEVSSFVSLFAGRIADTGRDPVPLVRSSLEILRAKAPAARLIWASPREVLNILQADETGCDVITVTSNLLGKLRLIGKDLLEFSLETVKMFYDDAAAAGYSIDTLDAPRGTTAGGRR